MNAIILNAPTAHKRKVTVTPLEKHYEEPGEQPYIKYNCPVCTAVGNADISIAKGVTNCPLCGVNLNWDRKPKVGDTLIINDNPIEDDWEPEETDLKNGTICTLIEDHSEDKTYDYPYKIKAKENKLPLFFPLEAFAILEENEE